MAELTDEQKKELEEARKKAEEEQKKLEELQTELKNKETELEQKKGELEDYDTRKQALSSELERVERDIASKKEERRNLEAKDKSFQENFRNEQLLKAERKFFEKFKYSDESQKQKLLEVFGKLDSGKVDAENIYEDLVATHVFLNKEKYVKLEEKAIQFAGDADKFLESQSSFSSASPETREGEGEVELTDDDRRAMQWGNVPLEAYRELKKKGKID